MSAPGLLILGFGGHARSVADIALASGIRDLLFYDPNCQPGENFLGHPTTAVLPGSIPDGWDAFPAAGANEARQRQMDTGGPFEFCSLIAPSAYIGVGATIDVGSLIAHHAHVGPLASVGKGCIVNTGAVIDHESCVGDFCHVSVNTTVAGRCRIGRRVFLGAGSVVIDGTAIADDVTIGAGATVVFNLEEAGVYVGTPARRRRVQQS